MLSVRADAGGLSLEDLPDPAPGSTGVSVRVTHVGICGSDLDLVRRGSPSSVTLGHEIAGTLVDGTPVGVEPLLPCGLCRPCRSGEYNLCVRDLWMGGSVDGGMTSEIMIPERSLVAVPKSVELRNACLVEPTAVALHGVRRLSLVPGERVAVIGGGAVGLTAAAIAIAEGCDVTVVARHPRQREVAEAFGAAVDDRVTDQDAVIAAGGGAGGVAAAVESTRSGGRVLVLTVPQEAFVPPAAFFREITVVTSMAYAGSPRRDIDVAMTFLAQHPQLAQLITHRFPLRDAEAAFATAADRAAGAIKVVLEVDHD